MGKYARVFTLPRGDEHLNTHIEDDDPLVLYQNYDGFAVLTGTRNYCSIVPLFECHRPWPPFMEEMKKLKEGDKGAMETPWDFHFHTYHPVAWFTPEELNTIDLDRPLEFLPVKETINAVDKHRLDAVLPGDTYRTFIERETSLMEWFDAISEANPEFVVIAYD